MHLFNKATLGVVAIALFSGCGSSRNATSDLERELDDSASRMVMLQSELEAAEAARARYEADLARRNAELADFQQRAPVVAAMPDMGAAPVRGSGSLDLLPTNARPGECYARVFTPPEYESRSEQVVTREAGERIEVNQALFQSVAERYTAEEAGEKLLIYGEGGSRPTVRTLSDGTIEITPTGFETVTERVLVKEATERLEVIPERYETRSEQILVRPARQVWKPTTGRIYGTALHGDDGELITRVDATRGEVVCLVEEPAEYKTITRRVLVQAASTRRVAMPAEYKTITKRIPKAVTIRRVATEAKYATYTRQQMTRPASERRIAIPAQYETVTQRIQTGEGRMLWLPVLCDQNMTRTTVRDLQYALQAAGHNPGSLDGVIGPATMRAVSAFQRARGLAVGELTLETLQALGVSTY